MSKASCSCWPAKAPEDRRRVQGFLHMLVCKGSGGSASCPRLPAPAGLLRFLRIGAVSKASFSCWSAKAPEDQCRVQGFLHLLVC